MEVISTRKYEAAKPTANVVTHTNDMVIDPENSIATVIKEEWETRKKKEITTTRQIETRVKRQVVLEDGEVIKDSGPLVTTNTTEDVEQQEHTTQEKRTNNDDNQLNLEWKKKNGDRFVQKELNETVVKSREEVEELLETEDRRQFGDITDEAYEQAVRNNRQKDLRLALAESCAKSSLQISEAGPRIIQHTTKSNKVIDTEKKLERKGLKPNGTIVTETQTSVTHEEISDVPDYSGSNNKDTEDIPTETVKESSKKFLKKREEDIVDYVLNGERIARQKHYVSETTEGDQIGDWPQNIKTVRLTKSPAENNSLNRKDALTKKPLDLEEEDEARKFETSKWLENHFGSESRSSHGSITFDHDIEPITTNSTKQVAANTSFINVTMKSCTPRDRKYKSYNISNHHDRKHTQQQQEKNYQEKNYQEQESSKQHNGHHHSQQSYHYQYHKKKSSKGNSGSGGYSDNGYFQGISEWSERHRGSLDKQNNNDNWYPSHDCITETQQSNGYCRQGSPLHKQMDNQKNSKDIGYVKTYETSTLGRRREYQQHSSSPPSPPIRRSKSRHVPSHDEKSTYIMESRQVSSSPVQVIQTTWENRNREIQEHERVESNISSPDNHLRYSPPRFRSASPPPLIKISLTPTVRREKKSEKSNTDKNNSRSTRNHSSKSKISESFKRFVDKLRSASTERNKNNNKKIPISSTSQLTQTDDDNSTSYLQYNSVDKNIPEIKSYEINGNKYPERPPRSPRNSSTVITSNSPVHKTIKVTRLNGHVANYDQYGRNNSITPVHRYYIEESVPGKNDRHDRSMVSNYGTSRKHGKIRRSERDVIDYNNAESASLGRFSKSTSRLSNNYDQQDDYHHHIHRQPHQQFTSAQTLPRKLHLSTNYTSKSAQSQSTINRNNRPPTSIITHPNKQHEIPLVSSLKSSNQPSRHYGSMINISIKNALSPSTTIHEDAEPAPAKPERTYKSSLLRSKSFNVLEASTPVNGTRNYTPKSGYKSNTQLNRLVDESPPLKSPSILASINRSNRDLFKEENY